MQNIFLTNWLGEDSTKGEKKMRWWPMSCCKRVRESWEDTNFRGLSMVFSNFNKDILIILPINFFCFGMVFVSCLVDGPPPLYMNLLSIIYI